MSYSRISAPILGGLLALLLAGGGSAARSASTLQLVPVVTGLSSPLYVTAPSNEANTLYVVQQGGRVKKVVGGVVQSGNFLDISKDVSSGGEQGLLSIAFSPTYATDGLFYADYTDKKGDTHVVQYQPAKSKKGHGSDKGGGGNGKGPKSKNLLTVKQPYDNHKGGQLQFGSDGKLYVGMGDGGSGGDPQNNGQRPGSKLGKLLRAAGPSFTSWETAGFGLRNPWRFSFDRANGDLYIGDVGQGSWEEIDYQSVGSAPANYGWSRYEGNHDYNTSIALDPPTPLVFPVTEYDHTGNCSVIGGYVYRGASMPDQQGRYFYGDLCSGTIWSLLIVGGAATDIRVEPITVSTLASFGEDSAGELYAVSLEGTVYRLSECC